MSRRKSSSGMKRKKLGRDYCFGGTLTHTTMMGRKIILRQTCNQNWYVIPRDIRYICIGGFDIVFDNKRERNPPKTKMDLGNVSSMLRFLKPNYEKRFQFWCAVLLINLNDPFTERALTFMKKFLYEWVSLSAFFTRYEGISRGGQI